MLFASGPKGLDQANERPGSERFESHSKRVWSFGFRTGSHPRGHARSRASERALRLGPENTEEGGSKPEATPPHGFGPGFNKLLSGTAVVVGGMVGIWKDVVKQAHPKLDGYYHQSTRFGWII